MTITRSHYLSVVDVGSTQNNLYNAKTGHPSLCHRYEKKCQKDIPKCKVGFAITFSHRPGDGILCSSSKWIYSSTSADGCKKGMWMAVCGSFLAGKALIEAASFLVCCQSRCGGGLVAPSDFWRWFAIAYIFLFNSTDCPFKCSERSC